MSATTSSPEAALASGDVLFWQAHITLAAKHPSRGDAAGRRGFRGPRQDEGQKGALTVGHLMDLQFDPQDRLERAVSKLAMDNVAAEVARTRKRFRSPGEGRSGASIVIREGLNFHRSGDPGWGEPYRGGMAALLEYYRTDKVINGDGMRRYDNDFRDAWTFQVAILWELPEESGLFTDQERLDYTNLVIHLGLACVLYQAHNRPDVRDKWLRNTRIVHNHNTFPALGLLFIGEYMKRHYGAAWADDWVAAARGVFNGLKHTSKPMEDAASYHWLPLMHCAIYSLSQGDLAFLEEGHLKRAALDALQVMDKAGYQVAFGDHDAEMAAGGLGDVMQLAAWYYRDPEFVWGVQRAASPPLHPLGQTYAVRLEPRAAGVAVIAKDGKIETRHALPARAEGLVLVGNQAVVTESNGQVAAVRLP